MKQHTQMICSPLCGKDALGKNGYRERDIQLYTDKRTDESCARRIEKRSVFPTHHFHTDNWQRCRKNIPAEKYILEKDTTWKIERQNLNFRTHIKRRNAESPNYLFFKKTKIFDNVIGMYINRDYFTAGLFLKSA